ncbi:HEAT repeat domain-containing protein, partial [Methanocalculus sp.]|uniref:HEAT repeat domain-containing protein n=1 Tax=Methanocalculus sp. TaxID=2004547 RepID=UPI0026078FAF
DEREGKRINLRYSLIPIPIHARIFDPTLGFSLLGWSAFLNTIDQSRFLPQKEDLLHYYCQKIASFWEMPPGKVEHYFGNHQLSYISTVYGPLPALESDELYVSIKNKIADDPEMLGNRFRRRNLNKEHQKYERYLMQGPGTIPELQYLVLNLHDILSFCALNRVESEIERFQEINMRLFGMIFMIPESVILGRPSNSSDNQDLVMSNERPEMMKADNKSEIHRSVWQNHVMKKAMLSLESRNISARVSAVRMMRNGNVPIDIEFLKRVLEDNIASVQLEVLRTIREHFIPFPPHALYQVEHSRERRVRHAAIDAISSISSQEALEVLEKIALENPRDSAKRAIRAIIIKKDADVDPILYKIIETTKDSQIRAFALHHVDGNRSREIVPLLIKCLDDSQISVRSAAVSALAKIGAPDAFEVFKKRYSVESSKNVKDLLKKEILNIKPDLRLESSTEIIDSQPIRIKNLSESQIAESDSLKRT